VTLPPSNVPPPPVHRPDPKKPPARGTRSTGYGEEAGAPPAVWKGADVEDTTPPNLAAPAAPPKPSPAATPSPGAPASTAPGAPPPARVTPPAKAPASVAGRVPGTPAAIVAPGAHVAKPVAKPAAPPVPAPFPPEEARAECEALLARYPQKAAALIPLLHVAQRRMGGWISPAIEAGVAKYLGVSDQHVRGVVTFYTMFNTKPVGRHHVQVCRTMSCWLRGAADLTACVSRKAGIALGETSADGRFTLSEVECIGLCEQAPAIFVNETEHASVTVASLEALLDGLK
jgi:NADH-quinone oxidoreductase subunit E